MTNTHVLEIAEFALSPDADRGAFQTALKDTNAFVAAQPGFVDRRTAELPDGRWIDVVEWQSKAQAEAAAAKFMSGQHPELSGFIAALDMTTGSMRHATIAARSPG
jgi:hypothetical protein